MAPYILVGGLVPPQALLWEGGLRRRSRGAPERHQARICGRIAIIAPERLNMSST